MDARTRTQLPKHIEGLLRFLSKPNEKANEDLAVAYFRQLYPEQFVRQVGANGADGYVPGYFVLELKGRTGDWFAGLCQGIAYKRELDFSTVVVAAKEFLAVWRLEDIPEQLRTEILSTEGAPSILGQRFARKFSDRKRDVLKKAIWQGRQMFLSLFSAEQDVVLDEVRNFEATLREAKKVRGSVTPRNFTAVLKQMSQYFDTERPINAVNAFYTMVHAWDEHSVLQLSQRATNQATLGGELIRDLIPGKRAHFKEFVESHAVRLADGENPDDFFARYDEALDAADKDFRIRNGIFFTDLDLSKLALWLVKQHVPNLGRNYIVVDPACGSGNLVTNWRSPLELRHKVVSEIAPDLLYVVERRMKGDQWHDGKFTVVPKISEGRGLNFLDKSAADYLDELTKYLKEKGYRADKPLAFLCNPPYRSDDDQSAAAVDYVVHESIVNVVGKDASAERYCCFLAQMKMICQEAMESGLPGESILLVFTKSAWLTDRTMFRQIRRNILGQFEDCAGFLVNSRQFFDVKGKFPVAFTIWKYLGPDASLDADRPVPLVDLTGLSKQQVAGLPWDRPMELDETCKALFDRSTRVYFGVQRKAMKEWIAQSMTDFKRSRRKAEKGAVAAGGLPVGDARLRNKKVYGTQDGAAIGFMDDLTPCRTNKPAAEAPHFHLDPRFMRVRDSRCLSGHSDHYSYQPNTPAQAQKLIFWYAIGRTFAEVGYPMWVDAAEIWAPSPNYSPEGAALSYALAIALGENDCVETRFPADNPVRQAPEIFCTNPMAPIGRSYWLEHLEQSARKANVSAVNDVISAVHALYALWRRRFEGCAEIFVPYARSYFIGSGALRETAGIVQIRDYAEETNDPALLDALQHLRSVVKRTKQEFYDLLIAENGVNYFGQPQVRREQHLDSRTAVSQFEKVLDRRLGLASAIVDELGKEKSFGRTKLAKLLYLADVSESLNLQTTYFREAAGPLDPRALYNEQVGIEPLAAKRGYFEAKKTDRGIRYIARRNLDTIVRRAPQMFGDKWPGVVRLIELLRPLSTDQSEIVATLYACWNDLLLKQKRVDDEAIIREFLKWHEKKRRFSKPRLVKALAWMRANKIVPTGRGKPISVRVARLTH